MTDFPEHIMAAVLARAESFADQFDQMMLDRPRLVMLRPEIATVIERDAREGMAAHLERDAETAPNEVLALVLREEARLIRERRVLT